MREEDLCRRAKNSSSCSRDYGNDGKEKTKAYKAEQKRHLPVYQISKAKPKSQKDQKPKPIPSFEKGNQVISVKKSQGEKKAIRNFVPSCNTSKSDLPSEMVGDEGRLKFVPGFHPISYRGHRRHNAPLFVSAPVVVCLQRRRQQRLSQPAQLRWGALNYAEVINPSCTIKRQLRFLKNMMQMN